LRPVDASDCVCGRSSTLAPLGELTALPGPQLDLGEGIGKGVWRGLWRESERKEKERKWKEREKEEGEWKLGEIASLALGG